MSHLNIEFKARCNNPQGVEMKIRSLRADYHGEDHQIDTYFYVSRGRLKIREGNIEKSLIYYERENVSGAKDSNVILHHFEDGSGLKQILEKLYAVKTVVDKKRKIFFIDNVKFHVDEVKDLGSFLEVEAIDLKGEIGREKLQEQCDLYKRELGVRGEDLISVSYSDMLLEGKQ